MSWLDEIKEKVAEASELADEDDTATLLWSSAELGSYVPKLIAYIDKLHEAIATLSSEGCPPGHDCDEFPDEEGISRCKQCAREWISELAEEVVECG